LNLLVASSIENPVLRGCFPDPSLIRVGDWFYLANSSFEWLPGIPVHRSRDLQHWEFVGGALGDGHDLRGVPSSGGIWAPSLSYAQGRFWLVYSIVRTIGNPYKDVANFLVTALTPAGPWSPPTYLNSSGFDPSLYHEDGRVWLLNLQWDHRSDHNSFAGIRMQEYDPAGGKLFGPARIVHRAEHLVEGPNLYRHDGRYYLLLAEGGTGWNHGVAMARSEHMSGPYEVDPQPVLTTRDTPDAPLLKAGHGELVQDTAGDWHLVHLASRPVSTPDGPRSILGRETCVQPVVWSPDGWLRLPWPGVTPHRTVPAPPETAAGTDAVQPSGAVPGWPWSSLRAPAEQSWASLVARAGSLRLRGRESLHSLFDQSLLARRITEPSMDVSVVLDADPSSFAHLAGLILWYDTGTYYYLRVTYREGVGRMVGLVECDCGTTREHGDLPAPGTGPLWLGAELRGAELRFFWGTSPDRRSPIGDVLDASRLSDDYGPLLRFTGAFAGIAAQDLNDATFTADFRDFHLSAVSAGE
jgi:xylan 1,4-beta-xylosidase